MDEKIFALGFFDGVHQGHQALLEACVALAREKNGQSAAITFAQHPQALFVSDVPSLINSDTDRDRLLRSFGIQHIRKLPVTQEIMSTNWQDFLALLLDDGAAGFVCGDDFRFGHKGQGDAEKLRQFCRARGLPCVIVPEQLLDGTRISSTHIRKLLEAGNITDANRFLGHPHMLTGTVVSGRQLGRTIGIPTANLQLPEGVVCPKLGVYACLAQVDGQKYPAVTNIGTRPTVGGHHVTVEPWILDFAGDLYGRQITLEFVDFLRPEQKFASLEELQTQIRQDAHKTRRLLQ